MSDQYGEQYPFKEFDFLDNEPESALEDEEDHFNIVMKRHVSINDIDASEPASNNALKRNQSTSQEREDNSKSTEDEPADDIEVCLLVQLLSPFSHSIRLYSESYIHNYRALI